MRTLHVLEPWSPPGPLGPGRERARAGDAPVLACRAAVHAGGAEDHVVLVLGGSAAGRRAATLGLPRFDRIAPPLGRTDLASRTIARWLDSRAPFELAILWSGPCAGAWERHARRVAAFDPRGGEIADRAGCLPAEVLTRDDVRTLRATRADVRERLGLGPNEECLCLLSDPPEAAHAANFAFLLALLNATGRAVTGLVSSGSFHARRALDPRRLEPLGVRLVATDEPLAMVLPACDLAVHAPGSRLDSSAARATWGDAAMARVAWSMGVPVLSATSEAVAPDARGACLTPTAHPSAIAHAITELPRGRLAGLRSSLLAAHAGRDASPLGAEVERALGNPGGVATGEAS